MIKTDFFEPGKKTWVAPFFTIWVGQGLSLVGTQLVQFALIWYLTKTTGSARVLAMGTLVGLLPQIFLGPFVGTLVDRWNRRWIMIIADSTSALAALVLAVLFWRGNVQVWEIFVLMFIRSVASGFHQPSMQASVTLMVPKTFYSRVQGMNQAVLGLMTIFSAPAGALLLSLMTMSGIMMIDVITASLAVVPLLFIRIPQPKRQLSTETGPSQPSIWQDFQEGVRCLFSWSGLILILVISTLVNLLLSPAASLLPILVSKGFLGQAINLAWMQSGFGIGTIVGGILLGAWGGFRRRIVTALVALMGLGAVIILLGLTPAGAFLLATLLTFLLGFASPLINGPLFAVVQGVVDPAIQGRVFTLITSFISAMTPIGLLISAPVADTFGVRTWYIIGGILTILLAAVSFSIPAIMRIEDGRAPLIAQPDPAVLTSEN